MSRSSRPLWREPRAHKELFSSTGVCNTDQPTLSDFISSLPEPKDDPNVDLTVEPQEDATLGNEFDKAREGSTITINTAYQGIVKEVNPKNAEDLGLPPSIDTFHFRCLKVALDNPTPVDYLYIWQESAPYYDDYHVGYTLPDGTQTEVKHVAIDNEQNLDEEILEERYRVFSRYDGGNVLKLTKETIIVGNITNVEDGVVTFNDPTTHRSATDVLIDGIEDSGATWYLEPTRDTEAATPTILLGEENPLTETTVEAPLSSAHELEDHTLPVTQQTILAQLTSLQNAQYAISTDGLLNSGRVAAPEVVDLALPHSESPTSLLTSLEPSGSPTASLTSPITSISGIGKTTAGKLSDIRPRHMKSKFQLRKRLENCEYVEISEVDPIDQTELKAAQEAADPPETSQSHEYTDIETFFSEGARSYEIGTQYFTNAIGDLRATVAEHIPDPETHLFLLHAGATLGHLVDRDGNHIGHIAKVPAGSIDPAEIEIGGAVSVVPPSTEEEDDKEDPYTDLALNTPDDSPRLHVLAYPDTFSEVPLSLEGHSLDFASPSDISNTVNSVDPFTHGIVYSTVPPVSATAPDPTTGQIPTFRNAPEHEDLSFQITETTAEYITELLGTSTTNVSSTPADFELSNETAITIRAPTPASDSSLEYTVSSPISSDE